jgi:hypothetical protein
MSAELPENNPWQDLELQLLHCLEQEEQRAMAVTPRRLQEFRRMGYEDADLMRVMDCYGPVMDALSRELSKAPFPDRIHIGLGVVMRMLNAYQDHFLPARDRFVRMKERQQRDRRRRP